MNDGLAIRRQRSWLAIAALLWCGCAAALNPDLAIKELRHTAWGPSQGAPQGGVRALAQTPDAYLWIASPSGLFRFDGIAFERVELPHDAKLSSLSMNSVFAPQEGGLWVGFTFGGVALLKAGHWQVFGLADGVPPGAPHQFAETQDGTLWLATSGGFARFDGTRWKTVGPEMGLPPSSNTILFVDSQGALWAGGGDNSLLFYLPPGEHQFRNQPVGGSAEWTGGSMAESSTGTVWLDVGTEIVPVAQNPPSGKPRTSSLGGPIFDHDGTLWDSLDGVRRIAHPDTTLGAALHLKEIADVYTERDGLTSATVRAMMVGHEGNVWVGTTQGLDRFSEPKFKAPLQLLEDLKDLGAIVEPGVARADDEGGLWVASVNGVVRYQNGKMSLPVTKERVMSFLRAADGTVWFGGHKALWRERQNHLDSVEPPGPDRDTQALAQDKSGDLWASIQGSGVFRLKDRAWAPYGGIAALPRGTAITIVRDRRDRLWFSYPGGTVAVLEGERVSNYGAAEGLQIGNITANHPGSIGHWFGGEFGLARLDGERFSTIQSAPEVRLEGITGIVETTNGDLWLNCLSGIIHIEATELERSRLDPAYRVHGETLGAFDGVTGSAAMIRPLPTAIEAGDGTLWFATTGGIFGIDPTHRVHNRVPPPVLIRALTVVAGHPIEPAPGLTMPAYTTAVRFDYVALSITAAEKVRYRYRLDGVDTDWHELTAARQALYTNLRPGHYTFRVIAANNDGVWNESGASLAFVIPRGFVQSFWFIALCVVGGAVAVWSVVLLRVRQIRRRLGERMEERLNERTRISQALHDSLLQGFQGLMFRLQSVRQLLPESAGDAALSLDDVMQAGDRAIERGRDAIQNLRSSAFNDRDLATSLSALGTELEAWIDTPSKPEYRVIVEGRPRELNAIIRDEAYHIAREAVGNAYQHAKARHIEADVTYGDAELTIRVSDDGIGMDPAVLARGKRPGHWGLLGMRERSESMGGHLHVSSVTNAGTRVELRIPAHAAYAWPRPPLPRRLAAFLAAIVHKKRRRPVKPSPHNRS